MTPKRDAVALTDNLTTFIFQTTSGENNRQKLRFTLTDDHTLVGANWVSIREVPMP